MTPRSVQQTRHEPRHHRPTLSALAQLIAGEILSLPPTCIAFAIHPDRTVVVTTATGRTVTLRPAADDGLYDLAELLFEPFLPLTEPGRASGDHIAAC